MAYATATYVALALAAASAGAQYINTRNTARRQDEAAAQGILNQGRIQQQADAKVNASITDLEGSDSASERSERLDDYIQTLRNNRAGIEGGSDPGYGSEAFKADAAQAGKDSTQYAENMAGLMARMDAPTMQRQGEAFSYGNLATDIGLIGRQSAGQRFIDDLRLNSIRRSAGLDLAAGLMGAASGSMLSGPNAYASVSGGAVPSGGIAASGGTNNVSGIFYNPLAGGPR